MPALGWLALLFSLGAVLGDEAYLQLGGDGAVSLRRAAHDDLEIVTGGATITVSELLSEMASLRAAVCALTHPGGACMLCNHTTFECITPAPSQPPPPPAVPPSPGSPPPSPPPPPSCADACGFEKVILGSYADHSCASATPSGPYTLYDGLTTLCDMDHDGGGWTLVANIPKSNGQISTSGDCSPQPCAPSGSYGKLLWGSAIADSADDHPDRVTMSSFVSGNGVR